MNSAPRSYLTPADRDAAMIEASKLRAMSLRRDAVERFGQRTAHTVLRLLRGLAHAASRAVPYARKEA